MTCKDCIHFKKIEYPKGVHLPKGDKLNTHGYCDIERVRGLIKPNSAECELFDNCWESVSK